MANIILLEPDAILMDLYARALESAEHHVRTVISAQEAIFEVDEARPDLIIVELQLVAHSGIEFLYELRSYPEWQDIPVLVQSIIPPTEFTDSMQLLRGQLGVVAYLYKPQTSLQALLRAVNQVAITQHLHFDEDQPEARLVAMPTETHL